MLYGLPQDFIQALANSTRKPVQLAVIRVADNDAYYVSDIPITVDGTVYTPLVESWGSIQDNSDVNNLYGGQTLGIRTSNITLIMSPQSKALIHHMLGAGIENSRVDLYQWFHGMTSPPVLIDKFVCQDPINIEENTMLFTIDLVSVLMSSNRRLYPVKPGEEHYPVVVGRADGLPMLDLNTGQSAILGEDLRYDQVGLVKFDINKNMPSHGYILIDEERLYYSSKNATEMNITQRGQSGTTKRPHSPGALAVIVGTSFRYAVSAGPVKTIDNIMSDGVAVSGGATSVGSNPAIVTFSQWPPNIGTAPGRPAVSSGQTIDETKSPVFPLGTVLGATHLLFGTKHSMATGDIRGSNPSRIVASVQISGKYRTSARLRYRIDSLAADSVIRIEFGYTTVSVPLLKDVVTISRIDLSEATTSMTEANVNCGQRTHSELIDSPTGPWSLCILITCIKGSGEFTLWEPVFDLSYNTSQVDAPEGRVRTFVGAMTARVTATHGANITPPKLVQQYILNHSDTGALIDVADFNLEHTRYASKGYYLNGILPAGIRVHEAIKEALLQGLARLKYNQGNVQFLSYFDDDHKAVDLTIDDDNIRLRSKSIEHYATDNIKNYITAKYDYNFYDGDYKGTVYRSDAESIAKFTLRDDVRELNLISSLSVATLHVTRMLRFLKDPPKVLNLDVFMPAGYLLEKGDKIAFGDFLGNLATGNILSIERVVGQGKSGTMNLFKIKVSHYTTTRHLVLEDTLILDDSDLQLPRVFRLYEQLVVDDSTITKYRKNMLELHEELVLDDSKLHFGRSLLLVIPVETVYFGDDDFETNFCHGYGDCGYGVQPYGD